MIHKASRAGAALSMLLAAAVVPGVASAHSEHDHHGSHAGHAKADFAAGEPGAPGEAFRTVEVTMRDDNGVMAFTPDRFEVKRGEQIKFVLRNAGAVDHEFLIDTSDNNEAHKAEMAANPDMQHAEPNGRRLSPGDSAEILWRFSKTGMFEIACLIPGHYEAGMKGNVTVK